MRKKLEFFYDYVSPYSYLANSQLDALENAEIMYRPMFLGGVMQATGNRPPGALEARRPYLVRDVHRWAERYGVPFRFNSVFPQNTLLALRVALAAGEEGVFDKIHGRLFEAMFVDDRDLGDATVIRELLGDAGLDADRLLERAGDAAIKDKLRANTEEAVSRGAFGAPTFFVGEEMFFGNDRLDFVRAALAA